MRDELVQEILFLQKARLVDAVRPYKMSLFGDVPTEETSGEHVHFRAVVYRRFLSVEKVSRNLGGSLVALISLLAGSNVDTPCNLNTSIHFRVVLVHKLPKAFLEILSLLGSLKCSSRSHGSLSKTSNN